MVSYLLIAYLAVLNLYTFSLMGYDKQRAKRNRRRVPEKRLFLLSAIGGAIGTLIGMRTWRHKTKHRSFQIGIPLLVIVNAMLVYGVIWLSGMILNS